MAQRLATEFVKARLMLPESQMSTFMLQVRDTHIRHSVRMLDSGNREILLEDEDGDLVMLSLEHRRTLYICEISCRISSPRLTHLVRKLFVSFKGNGMVRRIYPGFVMLDFYTEGSVRRIIELTQGASRLVFEHRDRLPELEYRFKSTDVETEIERVRRRVDLLLDRRRGAGEAEEVRRLDALLRTEAEKLFRLEA
ncbi:non-ribosomal peptide synthetase module [Saccharibacillus sp. CPCC 101409]|uniref:non-ribosomal peptide synthetase module n=1 Tax=Saccharibacillus sp. CPCC 101409 TaxID=3058041 RepID=UPI002672B761|nr:non-ribosomal peptide synthetase module [Saccharibacillus sp. CPCC 101409]MDO3410203.1 non-ribosomal peptide synthetase module [Saccharibacillus sp. CPCC 101409]